MASRSSSRIPATSAMNPLALGPVRHAPLDVVGARVERAQRQGRPGARRGGGGLACLVDHDWRGARGRNGEPRAGSAPANRQAFTKPSWARVPRPSAADPVTRVGDPERDLPGVRARSSAVGRRRRRRSPRLQRAPTAGQERYAPAPRRPSGAGGAGGRTRCRAPAAGLRAGNGIHSPPPPAFACGRLGRPRRPDGPAGMVSVRPVPTVNGGKSAALLSGAPRAG